MTGRMASLAPAALAALAASLLGGCAASVDIASPSPLGEGVKGKYWHAPSFVDDALFPAGAQSAPALLLAFDAAASGSQVQLAATWHDPYSTIYGGYARRYLESSGWASIGSAFGQIASDADNLGFPTIAAGSNGLFVASFLSADTATQALSAAFSGTTWRTYSAVNTTYAPNLSASSNPINAPRVVSVLDSLGRGYTFFADGANETAPGNLYATTWQSGSGLSASVQDVTGGSVSAYSGLTARFDGSKQVCVTYEQASTLLATCQDVLAGYPIDFSWSCSDCVTSAISSASMAGHETATDGAGHVMAVFYQYDSSSSAYHVYASLGSDGTWPAVPTRIDLGMAPGYVAPSPSGGAAIAGARPGVAYVGSGQYLAVWPGVATATKTTQLYSSLYDPSTGWSDAAPIDGTTDTYSATPHPQGLHVFSNGSGNAGFALNRIDASLPSIYPESYGGRRLQVARWQRAQGWLAPANAGNYCYSSTTGATDASCKHRPTGVILPSGNTLVFFMDRDDSSSGTSPGNRRLAVIEFKP